jgi:alpha-tubulin suppressor-like RCC1 family protein
MVSSGATHSAAVTVNGELYTWGGSKWGQLGFDSPSGDCHIPQKIPNFNENVYYVSCGGDNTTVITREGKVYTWGYFSEYFNQTQVLLK